MERMHCDGASEPATFRLCGPELNTVAAARDQNGAWAITSGIAGLTILKTTKSAFTGYIKDRLTTLKPARSHLGTSATAAWSILRMLRTTRRSSASFGALAQGFAAHHSMSVQHTLFDMGQGGLDAAPEIANIKLTNAQPASSAGDLTPSVRTIRNHIFVPIDEPHGYIEATIERLTEIRQVLRRIDITWPQRTRGHHRARRLLDDRSRPLSREAHADRQTFSRGNTAGTPEIPA